MATAAQPRDHIQGLTLALFVLGIFTDHHDFSLAFDDFALLTNSLHRRSDFHL